MDDADLRATIEGEVLGVVSAHGGERIIAGPPDVPARTGTDRPSAEVADLPGLAWETRRPG